MNSTISPGAGSMIYSGKDVSVSESQSFTGQLTDQLNMLSQALYETNGLLSSFSDRMLGSSPSVCETSTGLGIAKAPCATVDIMERAAALVSLARSNADLANRLNDRI